jgi:vacuolar-type H+-ATPase subunit H
MDELLTRIKSVEKQSIKDVEQAKLGKEESIRAASTEARDRYEKELATHHAKLKAEQEQNVAAFKKQSEQIVEKGKIGADKTKHLPAADIDKAVKAVYEMVARG